MANLIRNKQLPPVIFKKLLLRLNIFLYVFLCFGLYSSPFAICTFVLTAILYWDGHLCLIDLLSTLCIVKRITPEHLQEGDVSQLLILISLLGQGSE